MRFAGRRGGLVAAPTWTAPLAVTSFAMVLAGELLLVKGVYDWAVLRSDVAAQFLQRDRIVVYLAALLVAAGAAGFALTGERGPALAVLATAVAPVLLLTPGPDHVVALCPCLIIVPVGAAMALRTMLAPGTPVTLTSTLAFLVIAVAGGHLLRGLVAAVPFVYTGSDEEKHLVAYGRLVCGAAGSALLSVPLLWLLTGHRWPAALSAPFLLVVAAALAPRLDIPGYLLYALTGPMAMGAAIYTLFTDR